MNIKIRAFVLMEAVVAIVLLGIVMSISGMILYQSVWTANSSLDGRVQMEFVTLEQKLRDEIEQEESWQYDVFQIDADSRELLDGLWRVNLIATDPAKHILGSYSFLMIKYAHP